MKPTRASRVGTVFGVTAPKTGVGGAHADASSCAPPEFSPTPALREFKIGAAKLIKSKSAHGDASSCAPGEKPPTAVAYLRVSTDRQSERDGPKRQLVAIRKASTSLQLDIVKQFEDSLSGGVDPNDRPGLVACLTWCVANNVGTVIIERPDRIARELVIQELCVQKFQAMKVRLISADGLQDMTEGGDDKPMVRLIRQIIGAIAEFDRAMILGRLKAARQRMREQRGRCGGLPRFGETADEDRAIKMIARLARSRQGGSLARIAAALDDAGIRTRNGGRWSRSFVHTVLKRLGRDISKGGRS